MEHLNILIVEDEFDQAQRYKDILEFSGFNVVDIITNYRDAMAFILNDPEYEQTVDLLILDILLDGRPEGLNIAEAIDAMPNKQKPFIFVTNSTERDIFERAKLTKSYAYLVKPVNELELVYSIEQAIERFYEQPNALSTEDENAVISNEYLFIKKGNSLKKVHITDIVYIEVEEK